MKTSPLNFLVVRFFLLLPFLFLIFSTEAQAVPFQATVLDLRDIRPNIRGTGQLLKGGRNLALAKNQLLYAGDVIRLSPTSKATILFTDGSMARVNVGASFRIVTPRVNRQGKRILLDAIVGEFFMILRPDSGVHSESAVLGVDGTKFLAKVTRDQTVVTVLEGVVDISNSFGEAKVGEFQQSSATPTSAPTQPITINSTGFMVEWALDLETAVVPFEKFFVSLNRRQLETELQQLSAQTGLENSSDAQTNLGDVLFDLGRYEESLAAYQKAARLSYSSSKLLTRLGYSLFQLSQWEESESDFNAALQVAKTPRERAEACVGLSSLSLSRSNLTASERWAREAVGHAPESMKTHISLGLVLSRQAGRQMEARQVFENALQLPAEGSRYQAQSWLGLLLLSQNNASGALENAMRAVQTEPNSGLAHGNLALVYFFQSRFSEALREAKLATRLNPKSIAARVVLGQALLARGDPESAARAGALAVALDPKFPAAYYLLGVADAQRRDYDHALRDLRAALDLAPDFAPAVAVLSKVFVLTGRPQQAADLLKDALTQQPDNPTLMMASGEVYYQQRRYKEAIVAFEQGLQRVPSALGYVGLAQVALDADQLSLAIDSAQQAVQLAPQVGQYHAILGKAYLFGELNSQAERELRTALMLEPQNPLAKALLAITTDRRATQALSLSTSSLSREGLSSVTNFTQSFAADPGIGKQLLRGGTGAELELSPGFPGDYNPSVKLTQQGEFNDGRFHEFVEAGYLQREFPVSNLSVKGDGSALLAIATFLPDPKTNIVGYGLKLKAQGDVPDFNIPQASGGLANIDTGADISSTAVSVNHRINSRLSVSAGHLDFNANVRMSGVLHDVSTFGGFIPDINGPLKFGIEDENSATDVRLDYALRDNENRPGVFILGASRNQKTYRVPLTLTANGTAFPSKAVFPLDTVKFYSQLEKQFGNDLSILAQIKYSQHNKELLDVDNLLPGVVINYQLGRKNNFRFTYAKALDEEIPTLLTPVDALQSPELDSQPFFVPSPLTQSSTRQIDFERYLSTGDFLKIFMFSNSVEGVVENLIQRADPRTNYGRNFGVGKVSGFGARYERNLGKGFYLNAGLTKRNPSPYFFALASDYVPYEPRLITNFRLNYVSPEGNKLGLIWRYVPAFTASSPNGPASQRFGKRNFVSLRVSRLFYGLSEAFFEVENLFQQPVGDTTRNKGDHILRVGMVGRF